MPYLLALLLAEAAGAAALVVTLPMSWTPPEPVAVSLDVGGLDPHAGVTAASADRSEFVMRPLFWTTRRPPPPAPAPAAVATEDVFAGLQLVGLFGSEGGAEGGAIVRHDGAVKRVGLGQELNGWRLERIEGMRLVFSASGASRDVLLKHAEQVRGPAPGAAQQASSTPGPAGKGVSPPPVGSAPAGDQKPGVAAPAPSAPVSLSREERNAKLEERRRQIREKMGL